MALILLAGALGGVVRGLVGYTKYQLSYKNVSFHTTYFLIMVILSSLVGFAVTWAVNDAGISVYGITKLSPALAFIVGYAGGDFLENIYKILIQQPLIPGLKQLSPKKS